MRLKVRPLFLLLIARGSQAASRKLALPKYTLEPPQVTPPPLDILAEWISHVSHVHNLLPAEILILLDTAILFKIACMIYRAQKKETARTRLVMEIGNRTDAITLPVMELPYLAKHYRIKLSRSRMAFQLIDTKFGANLSWTNGVRLTNAVLEMSVPLPPKIFVPFWKVAKLRSLLQVPHFAAIRILSDNINRYLDVLVLRKPRQDLWPHQPQQVLSIRCCLQFCLQHLHLRWRDIEIYQQLFPYSALRADIIFSAIHLFSSEFSVISLIFAFNINF